MNTVSRSERSEVGGQWRVEREKRRGRLGDKFKERK
jgi:hypothetical protein